MRFAQDMCEQWPSFFGSWLWHSPHHDPSGRGGNVANVDHHPTNIFVPMTPKHKIRRMMPHIDPEHLDFFMGHDGSFIVFCKFVCFVQHPFPSNPSIPPLDRPTHGWAARSRAWQHRAGVIPISWWWAAYSKHIYQRCWGCRKPLAFTTKLSIFDSTQSE